MDADEKAAYERGLQAGLAAKKAKRLKELEEKGKADAQRPSMAEESMKLLGKGLKKVFG